ncbi:MAG TPA: hypothetical protein PKC24_00935 [Cyclobacteriaceae bacterium]|nr:hypothetical protein [Cyclobacteriaceae bacterium]
MRFSIILLLCSFHLSNFAQTKFNVTPALGMQFPFCYVINSELADQRFRVNTFDFSPSFDIGIQAEFNKGWLLFSGWQAGATGFSFSYSDRYEYDFEGKFSSGVYTTRILVGAKKDLSTVRLFKLKNRVDLFEKFDVKPKNNYLSYLVLFRLQTMAGISFDRIVPFSGENEWEEFFKGRFYHAVPNRNIISAFAGITFQFFNHDKDHFQLSFYYSKGFKEVANVDIEYSLERRTSVGDRDDYFARIGSRGSYFALAIGYPIRLLSVKLKNI